MTVGLHQRITSFISPPIDKCTIIYRNDVAHDMKSPTCALGLAVESLLDALDNNKPLSETVRHRVIDTLHGMAHTISTVNMIINRSVVRVSTLFFSDLLTNLASC